VKLAKFEKESEKIFFKKKPKPLPPLPLSSFKPSQPFFSPAHFSFFSACKASKLSASPRPNTRPRGCHNRLSEENQVHTYMHGRIKFHAYSDIKVYTKIVSRKKKKDYQRFTLNAGNEGSKQHRQSTGACVRLAPATSS
jgi:hypothetical protein